MKLKLKKFEFSNIFAYGPDNTLTLDQDRVTVVTGDNGAGKSSLPNAIEEALYNKNSRGIKKASVPNRHADGPTELKLAFDLDDNEYEIIKTIKATAKIKLIENGKDISGHTATQTYKIIEEKIGLDFTTFTKLVYQSTKSSLDFLSSTDANRKKFLIGLLGLEKYAVIEEQLKAATKVAGTKRDRLKGKLDAIERILTKTTEIPDLEVEQEVPDGSDIDSLLEEITALNLHSTQVAANNFKVEQAVRTVNTLKDTARTAVTNLESLVEAPEATDVTTLLSEVSGEYIKVDTKMATEKTTYQRFKSSADKTECPTCKSTLDVTEAANARDAAKDRWLELKDSRDSLKIKVDELSTKNKEFTNYKNYLASKEKLRVVADTAKANLETYLEANSEYINGEVEDIYQISDEIADLRGTMTRLKKDIVEIQESNRSAVVSNTQRNALLQQLEEAKTQLSSAEKDYNETNDEVSELEILTKAFGSKGLVAYKIEHSVKAIEKGINDYLSVMTAGRFALGFELDGAKLDVVIYDNGDKVEVNSLSTGQFTKVQLSTLLAIRKVLSAVSSVDVNFLFIDETVSFLDKSSKDTLVEVLLEEPDLNVFLVSHGYTHPLARAMNVVSVDEMSRIEV